MEEDKTSKKQVIIDAAALLFNDKGYSAATVRDLANRVGLEPSSLYSHIRSKEDLLSIICLDCAAKFTDGMNDIFFADGSPRKKLKHLISLHLDIAYVNPASVTVFNDEWRHLPDESLAVFLTQRKEYEKKFKKILLEGKTMGKFSFSNADIVFNVILKSLNWSYTAVHKFQKEELQEELTEFILQALTNK